MKAAIVGAGLAGVELPSQQPVLSRGVDEEAPALGAAAAMDRHVIVEKLDPLDPLTVAHVCSPAHGAITDHRVEPGPVDVPGRGSAARQGLVEVEALAAVCVLADEVGPGLVQEEDDGSE